MISPLLAIDQKPIGIITEEAVMSDRKQKLELTWIGKDKRPRLEPRVLVENPELSYHAAERRRDGKDIFDNMLIHGDNLLALKALEQEYAGICQIPGSITTAPSGAERGRNEKSAHYRNHRTRRQLSC